MSAAGGRGYSSPAPMAGCSNSDQLGLRGPGRGKGHLDTQTVQQSQLIRLLGTYNMVKLLKLQLTLPHDISI